MTDREKLFNLLMDELPDPSPRDGEIRLLLERLLANGVVVREWIPVTERLPEKDGSYLVFEQGFWFGHGWCNVTSFTKDGRKIDEYDFQKRWENVWYRYDSEYGYCVTDSITHWMPLPEPPKEVE